MYFVSYYFVYQRRKNPIIHYRRPVLLFLQQLYSSVAFCVFALGLYTEDPIVMCPVWKWFYAFLMPGWALPFLFKVFLLIYEAQLNTDKINIHKGKETWVVKYKWLSTVGGFLAITLVACSVHAVVALILEFTTTTGSNYPDCVQIQLYQACIFSFLYNGILSLLIYKAFIANDPYYLKYELVLDGMKSTPLATMFVITSFWPQWFYPLVSIREWILLGATGGSFVFYIVFPLLLSVRQLQKYIIYSFTCIGNKSEFELEQTQANKIKKASQDLFASILENDVLVEGFKEYLVRMWCVEKYLFYQDIEFFRKIEQEDLLKETASKIMNDYIISGGSLELTGFKSLKTALIKQFENGEFSATMFNLIQSSIYQSMKDENFEKWRKTSDFKDTVISAIGARDSKPSPDPSSGVSLVPVKETEIE